jgi:hypothetical protein
MSAEQWSTDRWVLEVNAGLDGLRELDPNTPTRLVYGGDLRGRLSFGLIAKRAPDLPALSSAVEVVRVRREHDQSWLLLFTLVDRTFSHVFLELCGQIYEQVRSEPTEDAGLVRALASIEEWRSLLKDDKPKLSIEEIRGLYAELAFAFDRLCPRVGARSVMGAWQGPYGADQDFEFPQGRYEVKSKRTTARAIQISSEYQLSGADIVLVVVEVLDSTVPFEGATSLSSKVREIRSIVENDDPAGLEGLDQALEELGLELSDSAYEEVYLYCRSFDFFSVAESFPRITSETTPQGITNVRYKLNLDELAPYQIDERAALLPLLKSEDE